jgi:hypothetical protein
MGRPLNKKHFGNTNTGSASTTADDHIGGEGVASVTIDTPGSYTTATTVTFSLPDLTSVGAVRATGTIVYEVLSATFGGTMTGYTVGQLLTVTTVGGSAVLRVATVGGTGGDDVTSIDFTGGSRGSFTSLSAGAQATVSDGVGSGCTVTLTYRVKSITITEPGSGYTNAADAAITFAAGSAAGTVVLTSSQSTSITISAYVTGGSAKTGDIVRQVNGQTYLVTTADGTGRCKLVAAAPSAGQMTMTATDSAGGTYYVTKLTAHKATIVKGGRTGTQFTSGSSVKWTFDAPTLNETVQITGT